MVRVALFFGLVLTFAITSAGFCQGIPGCYPPPLPAMKPCTPSRPAPISRTVQVDVPVPCAPIGCGPAGACRPHPCARPVCAPPPPTRPVQVRVDVVVRPEGPKPCQPPKVCCENPPVFEPFFYQAAGMIRSLILVPLGLGERLLGHCGPMCRPMQACPPPVPLCGPGFQPPPPYVRKCQPPSVQCATARACGPTPIPVRAYPAQGAFAR